MARYQYVLYLEPYRRSHFYKTMENFVMGSLAHYGLHEGSMFPPHCDMTRLIDMPDFLPVPCIVELLERLVEAYSPFGRPQVGGMLPVNNKVMRENMLCIPLGLQFKAVGGIVRKPYHGLVKEFRYDAFKHCGVNVIPGKMHNIPLLYNFDEWLTKGKKLSRRELQMMWDLAQETIDFQDAHKCAWHLTLYQLRRSSYLERHHFFVERPVESWEVAREVVPQKRWEMDWP